jgi:UDP-N-acetylmuramate--alanine ligase
MTVHMIGIGGCGMRGAAGLLVRRGARISGSDQAKFAGADALSEAGVRVHFEQVAENIAGRPDLVVYSAAVADSNPELMAARAKGLRVIKYAELLGELMRVQTGIAVAGTHGKSTTTAMCAYLFRSAGLDPSFVIGANVPQLRGGAGVGMGEHFIVEACEFDRSFLHLRPKSAAILNIEADHLDCYRNLDQIVEAFGSFAANVPTDGLIVAPFGDPVVAAALNASSAHVETFGFREGATWRATNLALENGRYAFDITFEGLLVLRATLAVPGKHNVANALAAAALAWHSGATRDQIAEALGSFSGVDRRMSLRGSCAGVTVVDDYAHHPTEVRVTLEAAREQFAPKRLWVVFQPHQHSRTKILMDEFAASFSGADEVVIPDVYRSRDADVDVDENLAQVLADRIAAHGRRVRHLAGLGDIAGMLEREVEPGDLVVTMGAGDVWKLADELVERLQGSR